MKLIWFFWGGLCGLLLSAATCLNADGEPAPNWVSVPWSWTGTWDGTNAESPADITMAKTPDGSWWMFYTQRRQGVASSKNIQWMYGCAIGIARSTNQGNTWSYQGTARGLDEAMPAIDPASLEKRNTWWAPCVVKWQDAYHLFVTYINGTWDDWDHPRSIMHFKSSDLKYWTKVDSGGPLGAVKLKSTRAIDPGLLAMPDGKMLMFYKDETDGQLIRSAISTAPDLDVWADHPEALPLGKRYQEAPQPFGPWRGSYWATTDPWEKLGWYRFQDDKTWTQLPNAVNGGHGWVEVNHTLDRAYVFYQVSVGKEALRISVDELAMDAQGNIAVKPRVNGKVDLQLP